MIEILRTILNFLISILRRITNCILYMDYRFICHSNDPATLSYKFFKKKDNFSAYISEGLLAFIILLFGGMLVSKLLAYIIDDPTISMTNVTHYFISLIILTIFVVITCMKEIKSV